MGNTLEKYGKHDDGGHNHHHHHHHGGGGYNNGYLGYGPGGLGWYGWPVYPPYYEPVYFNQPPKDEKKEEPQIIVVSQPAPQPMQPIQSNIETKDDKLNTWILITLLVLVFLIVILFISKN